MKKVSRCLGVKYVVYNRIAKKERNLKLLFRKRQNYIGKRQKFRPHTQNTHTDKFRVSKMTGTKNKSSFCVPGSR